MRRQFDHHDAIGAKVYKREYDMLSSTGEIILPETWEFLIKPGWVVEMRLWSSPEDLQRGSGSSVYSNVPSYTTKTGSMTPASSLKPPASPVVGSAAPSSSGGKKKSSIRSWFSGRRSRSNNTIDDFDE